MAADRTRRAVLAAGAACLPMLAVSGCKGVGALAAPPRPAPDVAILRAAIAAEEVMIARYDAVVRGSDGLAAALRPLRAEHRAHLAQLRSRLIVPAAAASRSAAAAAASRSTTAAGGRSAGVSPSPSAAPGLDGAAGRGSGDAVSGDTRSGAAGAVPAGRAEAISFLQDAERAAAATLLRKLPAVSPSLAQLMASVAASEATHVAALATAAGTG
ncbi:MAG: hypothetical protein ABSA03_19970 [Streptosporangiaceae bacterium]